MDKTSFRSISYCVEYSIDFTQENSLMKWNPFSSTASDRDLSLNICCKRESNMALDGF